MQTTTRLIVGSSLAALLLLAAGPSGCGGGTSDANTSNDRSTESERAADAGNNTGGATNGGSPSTPAPRPDFTPEYTLAIQPGEDGRGDVVTWTARVNTGGWRMTTESVLVEDMFDRFTARIYVILERPGADEIVTQAFATLTGTHEHEGDEQLHDAELSVKVRTRGANTGGYADGYYAVVKRARVGEDPQP